MLLGKTSRLTPMPAMITGVQRRMCTASKKVAGLVRGAAIDIQETRR
jgi:hypothetical protein